MKEKSNKYLILALIIGVLFHASTIFFTLENTYDALIHMFFAHHYATGWFEPWNYSWYTGFSVMGYPPLVHQSIALLSSIGGLKFGLFSIAILSIFLFITGVYRFTLTVTGNYKVAGYASLASVFSSSFIEALHIFGQLPSIIGISLLLHTLPEIYYWIKTGKKKYLFTSLSLLAVTVTSHHVTPIFGMVFFIFPLIGLVCMDYSKEKHGSYNKISLNNFIQSFLFLLKRILIFGFTTLLLIIICLLPYWINSKNNPITQVPIPHGSRDNFFEVGSSGLMFFIIPWGIILFILPYLLYRFFSKRYIFFGLSICLLFILGTGGTTPFPKIILGENAFNILTLDRFTFWATIMSLPILGEFLFRLFEGDLKHRLIKTFGTIYHKILSGLLITSFLFMAIFTVTIGYFIPLQPQKIKMLPIVNFINQDNHDQWRYLPLGFGDQMAVLSTLTKATTVDGNYHSARRLPELTSRAVERLENSKFRGFEGIGSLQQFLTVPEKYHLKYVFSNDKFYDPILYFCGWHRLTQLENGIMVWEKSNILPLSKILPKDKVPVYQKLMWGIIPVLTVIIAISLNILMVFFYNLNSPKTQFSEFTKFSISYSDFSRRIIVIQHIWTFVLLLIVSFFIYNLHIKNNAQLNPVNVLKSYYDALDYKEFEKAYSYINSENNYTISQFMLENAVIDGILNSYGKLDAINIKTLKKSKNKALLICETKWITPLEIIRKNFRHEVVKKKNKWFIQPAKIDSDIPPDQFLSVNKTNFYKHGRRKISSQQTYHEDVLKQPELEILNASLIKYKNEYIVIGELQNIDNFPADVTISSTLYDKKNTSLATFNSKYVVKHKLLPKETTSFKINFEDIAWNNINESKPKTFNPKEFTSLKTNLHPSDFQIQAAGNVAITDLYNQVGLSDIKIKNNSVEGTLFNYGLQNVTIPELIISYYNNKKDLIFVDHLFINEGIRVQRRQHFSYNLLDLRNCQVIKKSISNCYVNGLQNSILAKTIIPERNKEQSFYDLQRVNGKGFEYIKIQINNFIGNPNQ